MGGLIVFLILFVLLGAIGISVYKNYKQSEEKMNDGTDKQKLQKILSGFVPTGEMYTVAYAYWFQMDHAKVGRSYTTTYWYYAIGFNDDRIYIVPLKFEAGEIYYKNYFSIDKQAVGRVEGELNTGKMRLFDRNGQEMVHLRVEDKNNSSAGTGDINIRQEVECRAFKELIVKWTAEINGTK